MPIFYFLWFLWLKLSCFATNKEEMRSAGVIGMFYMYIHTHMYYQLLHLYYLLCYKNCSFLPFLDRLAPLINSEASSSTSNNNSSTATGGADLTNACVRLLLNLSFDADLRNQIVKAGMLPKLVLLMADPRHQNPVCCALYHLSLDDKVKSMFTYTECIPIIMRMILEAKEEQVDLEVMALGINLAPEMETKTHA